MNAQNNENGRIIILVLITVLTLSAFWFIALTSMGRELQWVGGSKSDSQQFFDAEAGLNAAMESFESLYNTLSLASNPVAAVATISPQDPTSGNRVVAKVDCQMIQDEVAYSSVSHNPPAQSHEFRPPAGAGSGVNTAVAKRYVITSKSGNKIVQAGVYWVVPK